MAGSILARHLDKEKIPYKIYDAEKRWRASPISENLFSLSWAKTLGSEVVQTGVKSLEEIVPISSINFKTKAGHNSVLHVHPDDILVKNYERRTVVVNQWLDHASVPIAGSNDIVVDCRGFWVWVKNMVGLTGQGLFIRGTLEQEPIMNFVAPYTHQKLFQWDKKRIWYGDSTCIKHELYVNRRESYVYRCIQRAGKLLTFMPDEVEVVHGIRPWVKGHKGFLSFHGNYIVNTGGWKCGLVIYAAHAKRIVSYIKNKL